MARRETTIETTVLPPGLTVGRISFCVELTVPQMKRLDRAGFDNVARAIHDEQATIFDINYDFHFGAAFFFAVQVTDDHYEACQAAKRVQKRLLDFLKGV